MTHRCLRTIPAAAVEGHRETWSPPCKGGHLGGTRLLWCALLQSEVLSTAAPSSVGGISMHEPLHRHVIRSAAMRPCHACTQRLRCSAARDRVRPARRTSRGRAPYRPSRKGAHPAAARRAWHATVRVGRRGGFGITAFPLPMATAMAMATVTATGKKSRPTSALETVSAVPRCRGCARLSMRCSMGAGRSMSC